MLGIAKRRRSARDKARALLAKKKAAATGVRAATAARSSSPLKRKAGLAALAKLKKSAKTNPAAAVAAKAAAATLKRIPPPPPPVDEAPTAEELAPEEVPAEEIEPAEEPGFYEETEDGGDEESEAVLGWSLKPPKKFRRAVASAVKSVDMRKVAALAKSAGPAIAVAFPAAAPAIAVALPIIKAMEKGDAAAVATVTATQVAAQSGDPGAQQLLAAFEAAKAVRLHAQGAELAKQAAVSPQAQALFAELEAKAAGGDPNAALALSAAKKSLGA